MAYTHARSRAMPKISMRGLTVATLIAAAAATCAHAGSPRYGGPGGIAVGAVIGAPLGGPYVHPGYAPIVGWEPFSFAAPFPVACPGGYWAHRPIVDRW